MRTLWSWTLPAVSLAVVIALGGCAPEKRVSRVDPGKQVDLSGKWNDTDSQQVSNDAINEALTWPWLADFTKAKGRKPVAMAFGVKNRTSEIINTQTFMKDLERAFLKSGKVTVVAERDQRSELREERADQQSGFTANPAKVGKETGADFVMTGNINSIQDRLGNQEVVFYQANLELINVETNEKAWVGETKIKKEINRASTKF